MRNCYSHYYDNELKNIVYVKFSEGIAYGTHEFDNI